MNSPQRHIIERLVWEVSLPSLKKAQEWEQQSNELLYVKAGPILAKSLDRIGQEAGHLILDRLELDLGFFQLQNFERELPDRLTRALEKALKELEYEERPAENSSAKQTSSATKSPRPKAYLKNGAAAAWEAFLFFLEKGRLPWWVEQLDPPVLKIPDTSGLKPPEKESLWQLLSSSPKARQRLSEQYDDVFLSKIMQLYRSDSKALVQWQWLQKTISAPPSFLIRLRQKYWSVHLAFARKGDFQVDWIDLIQPLTREKPRLRLQIYRQIIEAGRFKNSGSKKVAVLVSAAQLTRLEKECQALEKGYEKRKEDKADALENDLGIPSVAAESTDAMSLLPAEAVKEDLKAIEPTAGTASVSGASTSGERKPASQPGAETEAVYLPLAGLVLLHPFLRELFRLNGWVEGGQFKSEEAQSTAVKALSYLGSGRADWPEHQLLFPKFLCGMDWENPLAPIPPLNEDQKQSCKDLLRAVIQHWKALRGTSPEGLQEGFLQRKGKLHQRQQAWQLEIEHKTQDILIARLPWGYSSLKMPWMPTVLHVNWA